MNLKFRIVPNAMPASQGEAKYLGIIIPNGVRNRALMVKNIIAREHFSESTVNAVLDAAIAETEALCAEGRNVSWGPVKFISKMHGSFPYEDSAFEDGTASVTVDAEGTNALRALFADVVPTPMSAEEVAAAVKVSNVMDITTENFGEIHGTDEFEILGNGVTLDSEGESAKLLDRKTGETLATAETASVERGQRAVCSFAAVPGGIAKGAYVLEVTTFGLVGETTPRVFRKPVTLVEAIPAPTKPKVRIGSLAATADESGATLELSGLENVEAVEGYDAESGQFDAEIFVNGVSRGTDYFMKTGEGTATQAFTDMAAGDTVKVVLKVDPAKTEYDQTPAEATCTVTA